MSISISARSKLCAATLVEFIISLSVGLVVATALVSFMMYTGFSFAGIMNYIELESQSGRTLDNMIADVREAKTLTDYASNRLVFTTTTTNTLAFDYDPAARTLTRTKDKVTTTLLTECDSLNFSIFQRTPYATNLYQLYPTTLAATNCKAVQVKWTCSRKILGARMNTETVQSTKIVLRN